MTKWLIDLTTSGGLVAIFVTMAGESAGLPISSEIVVPLGGWLAAQGKLSFIGVVAASSLGNLGGSLVAYGLVRRYGRRFLLGPGRRIGINRGHSLVRLKIASSPVARWAPRFQPQSSVVKSLGT